MLHYSHLTATTQLNLTCKSPSGTETFRLWFESHRGSLASNLEQVDNLLHDQVNSAAYSQWDGT